VFCVLRHESMGLAGCSGLPTQSPRTHDIDGRGFRMAGIVHPGHPWFENQEQERVL
jgi:hypothetical protein